jgi:hypothetical protein
VEEEVRIVRVKPFGPSIISPAQALHQTWRIEKGKKPPSNKCRIKGGKITETFSPSKNEFVIFGQICLLTKMIQVFWSTFKND